MAPEKMIMGLLAKLHAELASGVAAAKRAAAKPAVKPAVKPVAKPAAKPAAKKVAKPAAKPEPATKRKFVIDSSDDEADSKRARQTFEDSPLELSSDSEPEESVDEELGDEESHASEDD